MHQAITRLHSMKSPTVGDVADTINEVRDLIADPLPEADQIEHLLEAVLTDRHGPVRFRSRYATKSGADASQQAMGSAVRTLVTGSLYSAFNGMWTVGRDEYDRIETLSIVLFAVVGKRAYGVERWQQALGIGA